MYQSKQVVKQAQRFQQFYSGFSQAVLKTANKGTIGMDTVEAVISIERVVKATLEQIDPIYAAAEQANHERYIKIAAKHGDGWRPGIKVSKKGHTSG